MTNSPKYKKWTPVDSIPKRMFCEAIHDDYEGFRILLKGEDPTSPMLRLKFDSVLLYRNIDEGAMLKTLDSIKDREIFPLYIVHNSKWIEWFHEESHNMFIGNEIVHYSIMTPDDVIDILSENPPNVEWLNR
ncbi:MAG: hypothetical protein C4522_22120 [Desulfobacteraceae bacterium]|nr:MAG: hypothetical protein C4522_22120 [Desulfobacteraceae bacterium]